MNNFEILVKLKRIYEDLSDIMDNSDISFYSATINDIKKAYFEIYSEIESVEPDKLKIKIDNRAYYISENIDADYCNLMGNTFAAGDIDYYWWLDEKSFK